MLAAGSSRSPYPQSLTLPSGYRAVYRDWGSGRTLLMLHGLMGSHRHWLGVMQKLKRDYRCIALDLLGFGESSQPLITDGVAAEVKFVREVVEALALRDCVLVGHSLGGWVATAYALQYQTEMSGLVLLAPAGIRDHNSSWRYRRLLPLTWQLPVLDGLLQWAGPIANWPGGGDRLAELVDLRRALRAQPTARQWVRTWAWNGPASDTVEGELDRLQLPTAIVAAERDRVIPLRHCQTYRDRIAKARLEVLPNAGHRLPSKHWRELLPILQKFLDSETLPRKE